MTMTDIIMGVMAALYLPVGGWAVKTNSKVAVLEAQAEKVEKKLDKIDERQEQLIDYLLRKNGDKSV